MARWKARVEFLLSVIELLFLSLAVEALQGKCVKTRCLQEGRSLGAKISGEMVAPSQYIDTTRKAIDCATTLPLTVFRSSPTDDLVDWNSGVSVRLYVRTSVRPYVHKKFFRFPSNLVCG